MHRRWPTRASLPHLQHSFGRYNAFTGGMEDRQIQKNAIDEARNVALKLMDKGSYQVECSDEGLMHEEVESCLRPVIAAAKSSGGREWALKMLRRDRMGFLCKQELSELALHNGAGDGSCSRVTRERPAGS